MDELRNQYRDNAANEGIFLLSAYKISGDKKFLEGAESALHYILGRNPLDISFVTGFGTKSSMKVHDRRSEADGIENPVPGMLAGGPFDGAKVDCSKHEYPTLPALKYFDDVCSWSTNEIAINWNAALVYLVNGIRAENK